MNLLSDLPDLEKTIIEIVVELLLIDKEHRHPELIYGNLERKDPVRITMHYVMALLSYGFSKHEIEMTRAADYFDKPFPKQRNDVIDTIEMNRLMVLLNLRPDRESVKARLKQLVRQQANGHFDVQPGWGEFDTLWTLEAFVKAKQAQVLTDDIITTAEIQRRLNELIIGKQLRRDKDFALALRLQYEMFGTLEQIHLDLLQDILAMAEKSGGMWGMREFIWQLESMTWYQDMLEGRTLSYDDVSDHIDRFRKVVLSTCMVVEYLGPLMEDYPVIRAPLERALTLWWRQFSGQNAVPSLRGLFDKQHDYDYLLVLSRTLRSIREYIHQPLRALNTVHLLRELTNLKTNTTESLEIRNIKQALRSWLQFDLAEPPEKLRLGFSDSNVVRIVPHVWSPMANTDDRPMSLIQQSLIMKYGPVGEINKERENYEDLPAATRDYFVRIPEASYIDKDNGFAYVIMQDLRDYKTLYEVYDAIAHNAREFADQLGNFLIRMHEGGSSQLRPASRSVFREVYLGKMLENIDRVFNFVLEYGAPENRNEMRDAQYQMFDLIGAIMRHQRTLEAFPEAYMHGDLHMRNIMVTGMGNTRSGTNRGMTFKLIDLEFMRKDGDAAFDAGQLIIDIEHVSREARALEDQRELTRLRDILERNYRQFSEQRQDATFGVRMELAKARALMRIAKGKTKRARKLVENKNISLLRQVCDDLKEEIDESLRHLQAVVSAVQITTES